MEHGTWNATCVDNLAYMHTKYVVLHACGRAGGRAFLFSCFLAMKRRCCLSVLHEVGAAAHPDGPSYRGRRGGAVPVKDEDGAPRSDAGEKNRWSLCVVQME